jgi:hypothetical protein
MPYHIYLNFIANLFIYHTTCVILQDDSVLADEHDQAPIGVFKLELADEHNHTPAGVFKSRSSEDPSKQDSESIEDPCTQAP